MATISVEQVTDDQMYSVWYITVNGLRVGPHMPLGDEAVVVRSWLAHGGADALFAAMTIDKAKKYKMPLTPIQSLFT